MAAAATNVTGSSGTQERRIRYFKNRKTISGRLHDEMVMMDPDQGKYFSLNPVATRIWDLLEEPMSADELCRILMIEYDVDDAQCRREVEVHLEEMVKLGLIKNQD